MDSYLSVWTYKLFLRLKKCFFMISKKPLLIAVSMVMLIFFIQCSKLLEKPQTDDLSDHNKKNPFNEHKKSLVSDGKEIFRFDTFGDEDFWSGLLHIDKAIAGVNHGGFGPGVSPKTALAVGLKVDADALPSEVVAGIKSGALSLDDPATTIALLKLNAVVGV